jgi:hypothetical protein
VDAWDGMGEVADLVEGCEGDGTRSATRVVGSHGVWEYGTPPGV